MEGAGHSTRSIVPLTTMMMMMRAFKDDDADPTDEHRPNVWHRYPTSQPNGFLMWSLIFPPYSCSLLDGRRWNDIELHR